MMHIFQVVTLLSNWQSCSNYKKTYQIRLYMDDERNIGNVSTF